MTRSRTTLAFDTIKQGVFIWRDEWGIPHVKAQNAWDAFLGLGYAHAQDRLWQMDMQRRRAAGRWAEWAGTDGIAADILARKLGGQRAAERDFGALGQEAHEMLLAYAAGVNAYISEGNLPPEYALLNETPEPWEPWNSIAVMRQIGLLMGSFWLKLFRAAALPTIGAENVVKLRYDDGGLDLLCIPPGVERKRAEVDLQILKPAIEALLATQAPDLTGGGSNNWAISGERSATGRPILMGDPHRELEVPTMYTQAHIACDTFDAIGLTVPGVPGFPHVAHNDRVAWCVTHAFMDIHDLFIERLRGDGSEALFEEVWEPTIKRSEVICVRGGADVCIETVETRHGPVILGDASAGVAISVRSVQFAETDRSFDCLPSMLKAGSVRELYHAVSSWGVIDHNLVAADVDGHIGHRVRAKVPNRPRENGWLPVPGWTGEHEWKGMIPFEDMPECIDPPGGRIVTANNRVVDDSAGPYLCTDCHPPHRARRITELLDALDRPSIETMTPIYMDLVSRPALMLKERLSKHSAKSEEASTLLDRFHGWNGQMDGQSAEALLYARLRVSMTGVVARQSGLSAESTSPAAAMMMPAAIRSHLWWIVPALVENDDTSLLRGMSWEQVLDESLDELTKAPTGSTWAEVHAPVLKHPMSVSFPDAVGDLDMTCQQVGGDNDTVFATGFSAGDGFATKYSALARTSFDVGDWGNSRWIVFQGASGIAGNIHRGDQNEAWASGDFVPMLYDWNEIASCSSLTELSRYE